MRGQPRIVDGPPDREMIKRLVRRILQAKEIVNQGIEEAADNARPWEAFVGRSYEGAVTGARGESWSPLCLGDNNGLTKRVMGFEPTTFTLAT